MSDATDREAALKELSRLVQPNVEPRLSTSGVESDLDLILDRHKRASTWTAGTAYVVNDVILPTKRTGRRYRCIVGGTSGTTEPYTGSDRWPTSMGARVTDGTSDPVLTWVEDGPEYPNIYDVRGAAYECWMLKTSKASQFVQDGELRMDQIYQHCKEMALQFTPWFIV